MTRFNLEPKIKALVIDMDGVLWRGSQTLIDLPAAFKRIAELNLEVILATNNSTRSREQFVEKFSGLGVQLEPHQIINSALATVHILKKRFPSGGPVFIVGESGLVETLEAHGFYPAEENVLAVVAGIDRHLTYQKIAAAMHLIRAGAPFYGTNPDRTYPMPDRLIPGAGVVLAAIETATDIKPVIAGKPYPTMMEMAIEQLGLKPKEVLVIGDRLDTDIAGGQAAGCRTAVVLTGVSSREQAAAWKPSPDIITENLDTLLAGM